MSGDVPSAESTVAVILGASDFPRHDEFRYNIAFLNAAEQFKSYLMSPSGFGLSESAILDLFDLDEGYTDLDERLSDFLAGQELSRNRNPQNDVILYYVGHGYFSGDDYFLALRRTRPNSAFSGYPIKALAQTLREASRHSRKYLLLDCCFAAKAAVEFQQAAPLQTVVRKTASEFEGRDIGRGTALLCASGPTSPALSPPGAACTMFTTALIDVLQNDPSGGSRRLSLYQIRDLTYPRIRALFPDDDPVRPEVHAPSQPEGDIAALPLFPTIVQSLGMPESPGIRGASLHPGLSVDGDSDPRAIQCLVVASEQRVADIDAIPLEEHVRRSWERHGRDISSAITLYREEQSRLNNANEIYPASGDSFDFVISSLPVVHVYTNAEALTRAIAAVCKADVVVFDMTDFRQAGIMLLLGVRAVARRGVTICSVGGDYVLGAEIAVPFNLQMLNLAAHSSAQERVMGNVPRDVIGKKIASGFRELAQFPDYLDLPAYDAVRRLGVNSADYRPVQYDEQILFLCPFSPEYSRTNWGRYLSVELSGKLVDHFRRSGKEDIDPRLVRLLDLSTPRMVAQTLYESIRLTDMCVIDWTECRPNVMFETGVRLATNPLGAVHVVAEEGEDSIALGQDPASHILEMVELFRPITYACRTGSTQAYVQMIEQFEGSLRRETETFDSLVYRTVGSSLRHTLAMAMPVAEELIRSANLLLSDDHESSGICPVLYHDVDRQILDKAAAAAAERRLAAWLYLERRTPDHLICANETIYTQFRTLGAQSRRWLRRQPNPDVELDAYIRRRMQEVRDLLEGDGVGG